MNSDAAAAFLQIHFYKYLNICHLIFFLSWCPMNTIDAKLNIKEEGINNFACWQIVIKLGSFINRENKVQSFPPYYMALNRKEMIREDVKVSQFYDKICTLQTVKLLPIFYATCECSWYIRSRSKNIYNKNYRFIFKDDNVVFLSLEQQILPIYLFDVLHTRKEKDRREENNMFSHLLDHIL